MKKIALLHPLNNFMPPLGLLSLAAIMENDHMDVIVIPVFDYTYRPGMAIPKNVIDKLISFKPDLIGIGFMSAEWKPVKFIIESLSLLFTDTIIVAGGRHASNFPSEALLWGADYVVIGEGETVLSDLVRALSLGGPIDSIKNLAFLDVGKKMHLIPSDNIASNLDVVPAYHLIPYQKFIDTRMALVGRYLKSGWLTTSRGCFSKCIYCKDPKFGNKLRFRSMDVIFEDIRVQLKNYNLECFYIIDDMFAFNEKRVIEFCDRFRNIQNEFKKKIYFAATARADTLTGPMIEALKRSGCTQLSIGAESGSQKMLDFLGTNKKVVDTVAAFDMLRGIRIDTFANFIIGIPFEDENDVSETVALIRRIKPTLVGVSFLTAYPGTSLYQLALDSGWINSENLSNYSFKHSENRSCLNFGVKQAVLDNRKRAIYRASFKNSVINFLLKKESYRLIIDLFRIGCVNTRHALSLFSFFWRGDIDGLKDVYRSMIYKDIWNNSKLQFIQQKVK